MIKYQKFITREMLQQQPETLFVFGDNMQRWGKGGQAAEMRGEPNAVGIPTKNKPSRSENAFFSDPDFEAAKVEIDRAIIQLQAHIENGGTVVWPEDGIGTGLADLKNRAPSIWSYIEEGRKLLERLSPNRNRE